VLFSIRKLIIYPTHSLLIKPFGVFLSTRELIIYPPPSLLIELTGGVYFYEKINYLHHPLFSNKAGRGCFLSTRELMIYPTPSFLIKLTGVFFLSQERIDYLTHPLSSNKADRGCFLAWREGSHRPRMIFVSIVGQPCRRPFQRWNLDRQDILSGGIPSSTKDLRFNRGPTMSEAIPAVEPRPAGYFVGRDSIVHE
jgi:hypothetical protein